MLPQFNGLSEQDEQILLEAIPQITILIAGADGKYDSDEIEWAKKVTEIRTYASPYEKLNEFYRIVGASYQDDLTHLIQSLPNDLDERQSILKDRLNRINDVLPKMHDQQIAYQLYKDLVSFAKHVAKASGGFLGFGSISKAERDLIGLDMIIPVADPNAEEEEA